MKPHFLFMMLACVALLCAKGNPDRTAADKQPDKAGHAPAMPQRSRRGGPSRSNLPKQFPKRQTGAASAGAMNPLRGPGGSSPAAKAALIQNPTTGRRPPVRSPGAVGAAAQPLSNVGHRSPNPAIIGGSADLGKRTTGAIDGKQVHRRP